MIDENGNEFTVICYECGVNEVTSDEYHPLCDDCYESLYGDQDRYDELNFRE